MKYVKFAHGMVIEITDSTVMFVVKQRAEQDGKKKETR